MSTKRNGEVEVKVSSKFKRFLSNVSKNFYDLLRNKYRGLIVLSGVDPVKLGLYASTLINRFINSRRRFDKGRVFEGLYVFHDEFKDALIIKDVFQKHVDKKRVRFEYSVYEKSEKYLGMTYQILIMDLTKDLKPNDVGRLIGIVEGGGLIVFLTPKWSEWDKALTIFKAELTIPQMPEPRHVFITWFKSKLLQHEAIGIFDVDNDTVIKKFSLKRKPISSRKEVTIPSETLFPKTVYEFALTMDQVNVIKLLESLYEKPAKGRKKVILITADRGRGKSCAVGIGIVGLIHLLKKVKPKPRVIVTAPEASNVQSLMTLAMKVLNALGYKYDVIKKEGYIVELRSGDFSIEYWKPLSVPNIRGDIVVVDEAAGIHVPMLHKIWSAHRRLVFSTTIHGYEGAGRGFSVRFLQKIKASKDTTLYEYEMTEPIRYSENDPIEEWQFKTLLLDAEPAELSEEDIKDIEEKNLIYVKYDPAELFKLENEDELRALFGIYVLAHYRNEPDDLGMLADAPHHSIRAVKTKSGKIVCAIQIAYEGAISEEMVEELLKGGKIPGNIIPDRFLKHLRYTGFSKLRGWRIVRIATHPSVQGKGIGSWALEKLFEEAIQNNLDWVAAGFGVNSELLRFWLKNGFLPVHMSPDRNQVSGEYTILVIKPISKECYSFVEKANLEFKLKLLDSLPVTYRDLEVDVAYQLLTTGGNIIDNIPPDVFTPVQLDRLWTYCTGPMTFESAADIMFKLTRLHWLLPEGKKPKLDVKDSYIMIAKALEGVSWEKLEEIIGIPVKELHKRVRKIACIYYEYLTGRKVDEHKPGVNSLDYGYSVFI